MAEMDNNSGGGGFSTIYLREALSALSSKVKNAVGSLKSSSYTGTDSNGIPYILDDIERQGIRYGMPYATLDDLIDNFDIARMPDYEGTTMPLVGHIIFTRPNLYVGVYGGNGAENYATMATHPMSAAWATDKYGQKMLHMLSCNNSTAYMPLFTTRAANYSVGDMTLKTVEKAQTYYGHIIKYATSSEEHKIGGSFTVEFRNDRYQSIMKAIQLWAAYIWIITMTDAMQPSISSQKNGIIDYAGSVYYLVTAMDMRTLVYWEKLTGVFPKTVPYSIYSYADQPILEDKLSIEFDYGMRSDPCDPGVLFDLNVLSCNSPKGAEGRWTAGLERPLRPDSYERPFGLGNSLARYPMAKRTDRNGAVKYELLWTNSQF